MLYDCTRLDFWTIFLIALYCFSDVFNCSAQSPGLTGLDYWTLLLIALYCSSDVFNRSALDYWTLVLIAPSTSGPQQQCPRVSAPRHWPKFTDNHRDEDGDDDDKDADNGEDDDDEEDGDDGDERHKSIPKANRKIPLKW